MWKRRMHFNKTLSRRRFLVVAGTALASTEGGLKSQPSRLTAAAVIERIQKQVGVSWKSQTVDTFKAGNPEMVVKGIATSFSATLEVCQRAAASGKNLIIVHEPTFYNHRDETKDLSGNIYHTKRAFIDANNLIVWRFHDHWHDRRPDGILAGMVAALGWEKYQRNENPEMFVLPDSSLETLAKNIQKRLKIRSLRVVGETQMKVRRVALAPGYNDLGAVMRWLDSPDIDVLAIGETREWEGVEYARDAVTAGQKKALIILGHVPSEELGMKECARWLRTFIPEVPIEYLPGGEPFWSPAPDKTK